jgi:hypothetical protein
MSYKLVAAVFASGPLLKGRGLISADAHLLAALAGHLNDKTGRCDPGYGVLEEETIKSHSTVAVCLRALYGAGFIDWTERKKQDSKERATNLYRIPHRPDPKSPKDKFILTPDSVRDSDEISAKFDKWSKSRFRTRVVQISDEVVQNSDYRSPESGREQVIEPGTNREDNREVVVGGGEPTPAEVEAEDSSIPSTSEELDGNHDTSSVNLDKVSDTEQLSEATNPVCSFEKSEPPASSPASVAHVQALGEDPSALIEPGSNNDSKEPPNDAASPSSLEGEYEDEPDGTTHEETTHGSPSGALELALYYFVLLGSPVQLKGRSPVWMKIAFALLKSHSLADIKSAADYALGHRFWAPKMMRFDPLDPFEYFAMKIPELLSQIAAAQRARDHKSSKSVQQSEPRHGGHQATRKSKQQIVDDANDTTAEQLLRELGSNS